MDMRAGALEFLGDGVSMGLPFFQFYVGHVPHPNKNKGGPFVFIFMFYYFMEKHT
jgi:hypothetical protein